MTQLEWFRQTKWTNEIEKDFERRLARSRGQRPEYLRIQAWTLAEQRDPKLATIAISLAHRQLELSPAGFFAAQMWNTIARASTTLGRSEDVIAAYRQAVDFEAERPNVREYAYIDFAWYVATESLVANYPEVFAAVEKNKQDCDLTFPLIQYRFFGALALIAADTGDTSEARRMARNAIVAAKREQGPFWRHPLLGLLKGSGDAVRNRLEQLAI